MTQRSSFEIRARRRRLALVVGGVLLALSVTVAWSLVQSEGGDGSSSAGRAGADAPPAAVMPELSSSTPPLAASATAREQPAPLFDDADARAHREPHLVTQRLRALATLHSPASKPVAGALVALLDSQLRTLAVRRSDPRGRVDLYVERPAQAPFTRQRFLLLMHAEGFAPMSRVAFAAGVSERLDFRTNRLNWIDGDTDADDLLGLDDETRVRELLHRLGTHASPLFAEAHRVARVQVLHPDGSPALHALVQRFQREGDDLTPFLNAPFTTPPGRAYFAWADAHGYADVPLPDEARHFLVGVAAGHRATGMWLNTRPDVTFELRLREHPVRRMELLIAGEPLAPEDTRVALWDTPYSSRSRLMRSRVLEPVISHDAQRSHWLLRGDPNTLLDLVIQHAKHGRRLLRLEPHAGLREAARFELGAAARLRAQFVTSDGQPIARTDCELERLLGPGEPVSSEQRFWVRTDSEGRVDLRALTPGTWDLALVRKQGLAGTTRVALEQGEDRDLGQLVRHGGSSLLVMLVHSDGQAAIAADPPRLQLAGSGSSGVLAAQRLGDGLWRFDDLRPGTHHLVATEQIAGRDVYLPAGETVKLEVKVRSWLSVGGRVLLEGEPVAGAIVTIFRREPRGGEPILTSTQPPAFDSAKFTTETTDAEGRYSTRLLDGEELWMWAMLPDERDSGEMVTASPRPGDDRDVDLHIQPATTKQSASFSIERR